MNFIPPNNQPSVQPKSPRASNLANLPSIPNSQVPVPVNYPTSFILSSGIQRIPVTEK